MKKTIALTGGGSGGHIFPLISIYNYFKEKDYNFVWVGEEGGIEEEVVDKYKIKFLPISAGKLRRYFDIRNFYEPLKNISGIFQGLQYIFNHKIDIIISKGGYVSIPLSIAGRILGKKVYIHESDTVIGLANRIVSKIATKIFYTFPNSAIDNEKHILLGQILNPEMIDYIETLDLEENEKLNIIVVGGSQGSTKIFEAVLKILPDFPEINFQIVLGEKNMHFRDSFKKFPNTLVHDFITQKRLGKIYKEVDISITRAGATSLWELYYFGIHSIIVPIKKTNGNHQVNNAHYFNENFGSDILDEDTELEVNIYRLLNKYKDLRKANLNLDHFFDPLEKMSHYL